MKQAFAADQIQTVVISPTRSPDGTWAFDDPEKSLVREPFVGAMNTLLDVLAGNFMHDEDFEGCTLVTSDGPFFGYQVELHRLPSDSVQLDEDGRWYRWHIHNDIRTRGAEKRHIKLHLDVWLCPVVMQYFSDYPIFLYLSMHEGRQPS